MLFLWLGAYTGVWLTTISPHDIELEDTHGDTIQLTRQVKDCFIDAVIVKPLRVRTTIGEDIGPY